MTEIKIEKKKPVWPWILGLAVIVFLIYFLAIYDRPAMKEAPKTTSLIDVKENNITVADFVRFIEEDSKGMDVDHVYTNEALLKLTEATRAMADEINFDVRADLDKAREYAKMITDDEFKTSHANSIRNAADILTDALQRMQQARYPELTNEVTELRNASGAIKPDVLTLDQKDEVKGFFGKAADLLKKMN